MLRRLATLTLTLLLLLSAPGLLWAWENMREDDAASTRNFIQSFFRSFVVGSRGLAKGLSRSMEYMVSVGLVHREKEALERRLAQLEIENGFLRETLVRYEKLDRGTALAESGGWEVEAANVLAASSRRWAHSVVIDKGDTSGIRVGQPVLHGGGLAGVVGAVGRWSATVRLLDDPQSAVGVLVLPERVLGVVEGRGVGEPLELTIQGRGEQLRAGQRIVTSGMNDSLYPLGLPVGSVGNLKFNRFGQVIAEVEPAADLGRVGEVLVLKTLPPLLRHEGLDAPDAE